MPRPCSATALLALLLAASASPAAAAEPAGPRPASLDLAAPEPRPATPSAPAPARLALDLPVSLATTAGLLAGVGAAMLLEGRLAAPACRWCQPDRLDRWGREQLRWRNTKAAGTASDVLELAIPAGAAAALGLAALRSDPTWRESVEDVAVVAEATAAALLLTEVVKLGAGRLRPDAWAAGTQGGAASRLSFWSGHTAGVFAAAAAATQVGRLRLRPGWRWIAVASLAGAAATGWLRAAADKHWLTDVAAGALVGTGCGLGVPLLVLGPADGGRPAVTLVPAPGGLALLF